MPGHKGSGSQGARPPATSPETAGRRIQALRNARGLTQEALARRVELSKSFVSEMENDHALPGGHALLRLAEVLGTTIDYIVRGSVPIAAPAPQPVSIPIDLSDLAEELGLSYSATLALLDARRLVVGRRGQTGSRNWDKSDWRGLYEKLREYLD